MALNCCIYLRARITLSRKNLFSPSLCVVSLAMPCTSRAGPHQLPLPFYFAFPVFLRSSTLFCAFLFTFYLMARLANIVPTSATSFDPRRHLTRGDVAVTSHGLLVTFKCTKTIQFGERRLHIPLLRTADSPLCPVSAYLRMIQSFSPRSPLLSRVSYFRCRRCRSPYQAQFCFKFPFLLGRGRNFRCTEFQGSFLSTRSSILGL